MKMKGSRIGLTLAFGLICGIIVAQSIVIVPGVTQNQSEMSNYSGRSGTSIISNSAPTILLDYSHGQDLSSPMAETQDMYLIANLTEMGYNVVRVTGGFNSSILNGAIGLVIASIYGGANGFLLSEVQAISSWFNSGPRFLWVAYDSDYTNTPDVGQFINDNSTLILESVGSHVYGEPTGVQDPVSNLGAGYRVVANRTSSESFLSDFVAGVDKVLMHGPTLVYGSDSSDPGENVNPVSLEDNTIDNVYPLLYYSSYATIIDMDITPPYAHSDSDVDSFAATTIEINAGDSDSGVIVVSGSSPYADYMPMYTDNYYDVDLNGYNFVKQTIHHGIQIATNYDTTPPDLGAYHEPYHPFPYQNVTVRAEAIDPLGVAEVILEYSVNGTNHTNVTMIEVGDNFYEGIVPAHSAGTVIEYRVYASDMAGNWQSILPLTFTFTWDDLQGPIIDDVYYWPEYPTEFQSVLVNATIEDSSGVAEASIIWFLKNSTWSEVPLVQNGIFWTGHIPGMPAGTVISFAVQAKDTLDNWEWSGNYTYTVLGPSEGPTIEVEYHPAVPTQYQRVTVSAEITDPDGVAYAEIIHFFEGGFGGFYPMGYSEGIWTGEIPEHPVGTFVKFCVYAVDDLGHGSSSENYTYTVISGEDQEGPDITVTHSPETPNQYQSVLVTAVIEDPSGVSEALILYYLDDNSFGQMGMTLNGLIWTGSIPAFPEETTVIFQVHAQDTVGNWNTAGNFTYTVQYASEPTTTDGNITGDGVVDQIVGFIVDNIAVLSGGAILVIVVVVIMQTRKSRQYAAWASEF